MATIRLAAIASSLYSPSVKVRSHFDGPYLTWLELVALYGGDTRLLRADAIYEAGWNTGSNNASGHMTGKELLAAHKRGENFMVGRSGGLGGRFLAADIDSGSWKQHRYETNREETHLPNRNWFWLCDFMRNTDV